MANCEVHNVMKLELWHVFMLTPICDVLINNYLQQNMWIESLLININEQLHACVSTNLVTFARGNATLKKGWAIGGCKLLVQLDGSMEIKNYMTPLDTKMIVWCTSLMIMLTIL